MRRVLLTGATGFIGHEVARLLNERGIAPRMLVRRPLRGLVLRGLAGETVNGDLLAPDSLPAAVAGVDTVIHLGAVASFVAYRIVRPSIVEGSRNLLSAAAAAGVKTLVYGGSLLVYPDRGQPIDQQTPAAPVLGYGRAKLEAETLLARGARASGMRFVSLRLPHTYGARSLFFEEARRGWMLFPGRGENRYGHLHVRDAARALVAAAEGGLEGAFVVADEESCSWNRFFEVVRASYPRLRVTRIPRRAALAAALLLDGLRLLHRRPGLYSAGAVRAWNLNLPVVAGTFRALFGVEPLFPTVREGVPAVLEEAVAYCWLHPMKDRC
ncbi:MAG: NAD(P)-dependent oxidoreductase [Desulfobacterales bacterium]